MIPSRTDRCIYVAFLITTTRIGKFIRTMTKHEYNHVALSLYPDLRVFYSFSRHHENIPFYGGFVHESLRRFPRDDRTRIKVCRVPLSEAQYLALQAYLQPFLEHSNEYVYNLLSAATTMCARRLRLSKSYTCVEFVTDALAASGYLGDLPDFCPIEALEKALEREVIYEGPVLSFPYPQSWEGDTYPEHPSALRGTLHTAANCGRLIGMYGKERVLRLK